MRSGFAPALWARLDLGSSMKDVVALVASCFCGAFGQLIFPVVTYGCLGT